MQTLSDLSPLGDDLRGYLAPPRADGAAPAVIVLMEAFGLTPHLRRVCDRLAAAGYCAVAPDLYHGRVFDYADRDGFIGALRGLHDDDVLDMLRATLTTLRTRADVSPQRIAVLGLCMGGRLAFLAGCALPDEFAAVACFYGGGIAPENDRDRFDRNPPIHRAEALTAPLLLIYGADDSSIPAAEHGRIAQRLGERHKRYTLTVYPDAGHGFLCEDRPSFAPQQAAQAFDEALTFLDRTLGRQAASQAGESGR